MKKTILILTASLFLSASWVMAQSASFSFNDNTAPAGTLTDTNGAVDAATFASGTGTFNIDMSLTFAGGTSPGYSLWLETETTGASAISITSVSYILFNIPTDGDPFPWTFTDTSGRQSASFLTDQSASAAGDLGATKTGTQAAASTYKVSTIEFTLSGLPAGTYHLETTTVSPKPSEATVGGSDAFAPQSIYTLMIVPEPATWSLIALGGLGAVGLNLLRARRKS